LALCITHIQIFVYCTYLHYISFQNYTFTYSYHKS